MSRSLAVWPLLLLVLSPVWVARPDAGPATEPLSPGWPQAQSEVALALRNAAVHPHLGLPDFVVDGSDAELAGAARTVADVLRNDIDFEREFYLISREASAAIPVAPADALPYDRWAELGADVVLAGSVSRNGADMVIRLRLIAVRGTDRGRQVGYGQAYTNCSPGSPRACAHYISDDFLQRTRAVEGVARTKLAFVSDRDGERVTGRPEQSPARAKEVYISDYDGANQRRITSNHNLNIEPVWSPDGGRLAYVWYTAPPSDIFIMNLRDPRQPVVRPAPQPDHAQNVLPAWSPDGRRIAFVSMRSGNADIWAVNTDGTGLTNLTNDPSQDVSPAWSPDGAKIAFISDRAGTKQLYVMSAAGYGHASAERSGSRPAHVVTARIHRVHRQD